jgi:DNA-binding response OmpR family regulator
MNQVLVLDDDDHYRELLELTLQDECGVACVHGFADGPSLLAYLATPGISRPELLLLDLHLNGLSGVELLREVRGLYDSLPVAFLSGAAGAEERRICLEAGAIDFVTKPAAYPGLVGELQRLLRTASAAGSGDPGSVT